MSIGWEHNCVVLESGSVSCWGREDHGQLQVPQGLVAKAMSVGILHSCALTAEGGVFCWGQSYQGQLNVPLELPPCVAVESGYWHVCALTEAGSVVCWGWNSHGQTDVPSMTDVVVAVAAGEHHTCAGGAKGAICWGSNVHGQLDVPTSLPPVVVLAAFGHKTCALTSTRTVICWGERSVSHPVPDGLSDVTGISVGKFHTCALTASGAISCWGIYLSKAPVPASLPPVVEVGVGKHHTCVRTADGSVTCFGTEEAGQVTVPADLPEVTSISAGSTHNCAITATKSVVCWGWYATVVPGDLGAVEALALGVKHSCALLVTGAVSCWGEATWATKGAKEPPAGLPAAKAIGSGTYHVCTVASSGGLVTCWGDDAYGQSTIPSDIAALEMVAVKGGESHTCAISVAGAVYCWGRNNAGQLNVPAGMSNVVLITLGHSHACSMTEAGNVFCWGLNGEGQGTDPGLEAAGLQARDLTAAVNGNHNCLLLVGHPLGGFCWGNDRYGQLEAEEKQTEGEVVSIIAGQYHTCILMRGPVNTTSSTTSSRTDSSTTTDTLSTSSGTTVTATSSTSTSSGTASTATSSTSTSSGTTSTATSSTSTSSGTTRTATSSTFTSSGTTLAATYSSSTSSGTTSTATSSTSTSSGTTSTATSSTFTISGTASTSGTGTSTSSASTMQTITSSSTPQTSETRSSPSTLSSTSTATRTSSSLTYMSTRTVSTESKSSSSTASSSAIDTSMSASTTSAAGTGSTSLGMLSHSTTMLLVSTFSQRGFPTSPTASSTGGVEATGSQQASTASTTSSPSPAGATGEGTAALPTSTGATVSPSTTLLMTSGTVQASTAWPQGQTTQLLSTRSATVTRTRSTSKSPTPSDPIASTTVTERVLRLPGSKEAVEANLKSAEEVLAAALPQLSESNLTLVPVALPEGVAVVAKLQALASASAENISSVTIPINEVQTAVIVPLSLFNSIEQQREQVILAVTMFNSTAPSPDVASDATAKVLATANIDLVHLRTGDSISVEDLSEPIEFSLPTEFRDGILCAFWDGDRWSTRGVETSPTNAPGGQVTCSTRHLSLFGAIWVGFVASFECSQFSLLSREGIVAVVETDWYLDAGAVLFGCTIGVLSLTFLVAVILDKWRRTWLTWSPEYFLIPPRSDSEDVLPSPSASPEEKKCCTTHGCFRETTLVHAVDEVISTWFTYFSEVRSFFEGIWESMECSGWGACLTHEAVQKLTSAVLLACSRRLISASMGLSEDAIKFVLEDRDFRSYIQATRHEQRLQDDVPTEPHITAFPTNAVTRVESANPMMRRVATAYGGRSHDDSRVQWETSAHGEEAWLALHEEISAHLRDSLEGHSWRYVPKMVTKLFYSCNPYRQVFAIDIFSSCKLRAFLLAVEVTGILMVTCLFYSSGNVRGRARLNKSVCESGDLQKTFGFTIGRALGVSIGSVLLSWVPTSFLESCHTVGFRTMTCGTSEARQQLRAWVLQDRLIWVLGSLYIAFNIFFVTVFLANISTKDHNAFALSGFISVLQEGVLLPLGLSGILPLAGLVLLGFTGRMGQMDRSAIISNIHFLICSNHNVMVARM